MNIVFDLRHTVHSGIGRFTREIVLPSITELSRSYDGSCIVLILHKEGRSSIVHILDIIESKNLKSQVIYTNVSPYSVFNLVFGFKYFWNSIVFMPHFTVSSYLLFARKSVVFIHDALPFKSNPLKFFPYKLLLNIINLFGRLCTASPSQFASSEVKKLFWLPVKNQTIYNGMTLSLLKYVKNRDFLCSKINNSKRQSLSPDEKRFIMIGNIKKHKNLTLAISSFKKLPSNYYLDIVGSIMDNHILENLPNNVSYLGPISDKDLFSSFDRYEALIFPSTHEGFGLPVLEALCCGLPVISLRLPVFIELFSDYICFIENTEISLMNACRKEIRRLDKSERNSLINKFSWDHSGKLLASLLYAKR